MTILVMVGVRTEAHIFRSQVGIGSESDCLSPFHLSPFQLYKLSARDFTCIQQIKAASLREGAAEKVVHAQARMTEHRKDSARRPYPSTVIHVLATPGRKIHDITYIRPDISPHKRK